MQPDASRPCFEPLGRLDVTVVFPIPPPAAVTFPPSPLGQGHLILKSGLYLRLAVLFLYLPLLLEIDSNPGEATNKSGVGQRVPYSKQLLQAEPREQWGGGRLFPLPVWFTVRGDLRYQGRASTKVNTGKEEGIWVRLHPGTLSLHSAHLSPLPLYPKTPQHSSSRCWIKRLHVTLASFFSVAVYR